MGNQREAVSTFCPKQQGHHAYSLLKNMEHFSVLESSETRFNHQDIHVLYPSFIFTSPASVYY